MNILKRLLNKKITVPIFFILSVRIITPLVIKYLRILEKVFKCNFNIQEVNNYIQCVKAIFYHNSVYFLSFTMGHILYY